MNRASIGGILALICAVSVEELPAQQAAIPATPPPQIVVAGQGEVRVVPDRASVMIGVQSRASTAAAAASENARRQSAIIDTLRAIGLTSEQISTANYSVYPETVYDTAQRRPRVVGYVVSNMVRAELRMVSQVGRVLDAALAKGANQIASLDFYQSNSDSTRRLALGQALSKARADAEVLARAAGGRLGGLLEVQAMDVSGPPIIRKSFDAMEARAAAVPTPIEPGSEMFRVMVNARWEFIGPGR